MMKYFCFGACGLFTLCKKYKCYLISKNIEHIEKYKNPLNILQVRGIKQFGVLSKNEYRKEKKVPKTANRFHLI